MSTAPNPPAPPTVVLMGVCGSGKSTLGRILAARMGSTLIEADDFHPPSNVSKMAAGQPLNDHDREPWLRAIRARWEELQGRGVRTVIACSALKRSYREALTGGDPSLFRFVWLHGSRELLAHRMSMRRDHFMPPGLLESQLQTLEAPEEALPLPIDLSPEDMVARILDWLGESAGC